MPAEAPATNSQMPVTGNTSWEATNPPDKPGEAEPAYKPVNEHAKGACLACGKQFRLPEHLRRRNAHRGWPPQVRCRPCKLANDAHYAALGNTAPATTVAPDAKLRAASSATLVTSDGETSPATTVAPDAKFRAASPAALVTSDGETSQRNWLLENRRTIQQRQRAGRARYLVATLFKSKER